MELPQNPKDSLIALLNMDGQTAKSWMEKFVKDSPTWASDFNWEIVAQKAGNRAVQQLDLDWASVAAVAYDQIAESSTHGPRVERLGLMRVRASLISQLGSNSACDTLSIENLVQWFHSVNTYTLNEVRSLIPVSAGTVSAETIRALRQVKNRLEVFEILSQTSHLDQCPEILDWLSVRPLLP